MSFINPDAINVVHPRFGNASTEEVRKNFLGTKDGLQQAKTEIEAIAEAISDLQIAVSGMSSAVFVREDLSSQCDGELVLFELGDVYVPGTLEVWVNGLYQGIAPKHFVEEDNTHFLLLEVLEEGEEVVVRYVQGATL